MPLTAEQKQARKQARREYHKVWVARNRDHVRDYARAYGVEYRVGLGRKPRKGNSSSRAEVEERQMALYAVVEKQQPMTVRQVFYQATVKGMAEKTEEGYQLVQRNLAQMRRAGTLPYGWITDSTRRQMISQTFGSPAEAIEHTARFYRKSALAASDVHIEIWVEKDGLSQAAMTCRL